VLNTIPAARPARALDRQAVTRAAHGYVARARLPGRRRGAREREHRIQIHRVGLDSERSDDSRDALERAARRELRGFTCGIKPRDFEPVLLVKPVGVHAKLLPPRGEDHVAKLDRAYGHHGEAVRSGGSRGRPAHRGEQRDEPGDLHPALRDGDASILDAAGEKRPQAGFERNGSEMSGAVGDGDVVQIEADGGEDPYGRRADPHLFANGSRRLRFHRRPHALGREQHAHGNPRAPREQDENRRQRYARFLHGVIIPARRCRGEKPSPLKSQNAETSLRSARRSGAGRPDARRAAPRLPRAPR
jgi:hypothetical protein